MKAAIKYYMSMYNYDCAKLAKTIGLSESTLYTRLRNPDSFKLDELYRLCRLFKTNITLTPEGVKMEVH